MGLPRRTINKFPQSIKSFTAADVAHGLLLYPAPRVVHGRRPLIRIRPEDVADLAVAGDRLVSVHKQF